MDVLDVDKSDEKRASHPVQRVSIKMEIGIAPVQLCVQAELTENVHKPVL
jgi:hypothetical protein